jgi:peptide-methionine (S)-S-oxide reductase
MFLFGRKSMEMPAPAEALPGRSEPLRVPERHFVNGERIVPPYPDGTALALFAAGCFWGVEKTFWQTPGVVSTGFSNERVIAQDDSGARLRFTRFEIKKR